MKKVTAVEFIVEQLDYLNKERKLNLIDAQTYFEIKTALFQQAKAIEKQQIKEEREEAYNNGYANGQMDAFTN